MSGTVFDRILISSYCCSGHTLTVASVTSIKILVFFLIFRSLVLPVNSQTPSLNFSEAILEVDTMAPAPAFLKSQKSMEVHAGASKVVSIMETKSIFHVNVNVKAKEDVSGSGEEGVIVTSDFSKDCGRDDKCPPEDSDNDDDHESEAIVTFAIRRKNVDYSENPYLCRCDVDECLMYGDCCWNVTIGVPLRTTENVWKCNIIPEQKTHAMMISECPAKSPSYLTELCAADPADPAIGNYTYLVDIPVYSKVTQFLYRNIYCARCHGERNAGIHHWKTHLFCSEQMTPDKQEKFIQNAQYFPGQRYFQENNRTCVIYISELISTRQKLEQIIPTIRYCGASVQTCPPTTPLSRDARLCATYTQHVYWKDSKIYKNPHCARCNGQLQAESATELTVTNTTTTLTLLTVTGLRVQCYRYLAFSTKIPSPSPPRGPQGISLLFDFALDSLDDALVGYDTLCKEDEIWDYLHKRCQMAVCQKGYYLQGEACHPILGHSDDDATAHGPQDQQNSGEAGHHYNDSSSLTPSKNGDAPINSTCMRILLFESEYTFMSKNNSSIIVNDPNLLQPPIIFHPDEYEYWNDTTLAVCAKDHEGLIKRFSSLLNYLSTISVGLSVVFSFLHILIYVSLPKLQNLPGKTLFCLTVSLFVSQLIFLTLITHSRWQGLCITASITMHYTFLAAFFWMNVMSFDIWRTFSGTMLLSRSQTTERKNITFLKYNFFAWGIPILIVGTSVLVEVILPDPLQGVHNNPGTTLRNETTYFSEWLEKVKPSYGKNGFCWFGQRLSLFIFFALPVALVITSNIILFSLSARAILLQNKEAGKVFHNNESNKTTAKKMSTVSRVSSKDLQGSPSGSGGMEEIKVKLYAKLALIMGLTWIMGFISNFPKMEWLWFPFVVLNGLQGTFIFFAFDCKWKILKMLRERYGRCGGWLEVKGRFLGSSSSQEERRRKQSSSLGDTSLSRSTTISNSYNRTLSTIVDK